MVGLINNEMACLNNEVHPMDEIICNSWNSNGPTPPNYNIKQFYYITLTTTYISSGTSNISTTRSYTHTISLNYTQPSSLTIIPSKINFPLHTILYLLHLLFSNIILYTYTYTYSYQYPYQHT
jgi:hypothetical protein